LQGALCLVYTRTASGILFEDVCHGRRGEQIFQEFLEAISVDLQQVHDVEVDEDGPWRDARECDLVHLQVPQRWVRCDSPVNTGLRTLLE
jgi:hypothetical protein